MAAIGSPGSAPLPTASDKGDAGAATNRPTNDDPAVNQSEITDFLDDTSGGGDVDDSPKKAKTPSRKAEAAESEDFVEDDEEDEEGEEDVEVDDDEEDDEDGEEEEDDEDDETDEDKDAIIKQLRKDLAKKAKPAGEIKASDINAPVVPDIDPNDELDLTDEEVDQAMDDPKKLKALLGKVFAKGRETMMRALPEIVSATQQRQTTVKTAIDTFYSENPRLNEHREYVGYITNKVHKENPDWTLNKLFAEVATRSYEGLKIRNSARKTEQERKKTPVGGKKPGGEEIARRPAFAKGGRGKTRSGETDRRTEERKEIDELLSGY